MTSMWEYRQGVGRADRDIVGYDVEATDGSIGKIDEASDRAGSRTWSSTPASGSSARSG